MLLGQLVLRETRVDSQPFEVRIDATSVGKEWLSWVNCVWEIPPYCRGLVSRKCDGTSYFEDLKELW